MLFMAKSTISIPMLTIFNSFLYVYQGYNIHFFCWTASHAIHFHPNPWIHGGPGAVGLAGNDDAPNHHRHPRYRDAMPRHATVMETTIRSDGCFCVYI